MRFQLQVLLARRDVDGRADLEAVISDHHFLLRGYQYAGVVHSWRLLVRAQFTSRSLALVFESHGRPEQLQLRLAVAVFGACSALLDSAVFGLDRAAARALERAI